MSIEIALQDLQENLEPLERLISHGFFGKAHSSQEQ